MKIKKEHLNIKSLKVCMYCNRILQKGIESKRGTCRTCNEKYVIKNNLKKWIEK